MELKDWNILLAVYKEKNITRAAANLFMSQPTVTYRLKQIEKELQADILYRGRRGVEFTEQGLKVIEYAEIMVNEFRILQETLWNSDNQPQGKLRIGAAKAIALHTIPFLLKEFHERYPKITYSIHTGLNLDVIQSVYKDDYHIGIVRGEHHWSEKKIELFSEKISVISLQPINLSDLPKLNRISYHTDPALNMMIDSWWREAYKRPPNVFMDVANMEIAKNMVEQGLGYAIVPNIILKNDHLYSKNLFYKDNSPLLWKTWLLYKEELTHLSFVDSFIKFVDSKQLRGTF
ncbi:LysR family transcriptional regulator [Oceanobacillus jeddahense]|uniref:LysR family transcriptional regulator n=1 Tax=Oceanobacillus jeddahense TaxID=1462527 RepID=UPI000595BC97|nr:LysR family transcriptional regulator [Oceanobacillus jeddahense]